MPPFAALLGSWIINAFWPLVGQDGVRHFSTTLFFHAATVVALLALAPWLALRGRWRLALSPAIAKPVFGMAVLSGAASWIYFEALRYTSPANAAVMAQVEVLYSALLAAWLLGERIGRGQVAASCLVVAGTGLIMAQDLGSLRWKGDLMILLTPWMYQLAHVLAKRLPKDTDPVVLAGARMAQLSLLLVPFTAWTLLHEPLWTWSREGLSCLALQGVVMNALSLTLWYTAILRMDLAKASAFLLSYPALTMLFSWGLGRETIGLWQVAGLVVTLSGAFWLSLIALARRPPGLPRAPADPAFESSRA